MTSSLLPKAQRFTLSVSVYVIVGLGHIVWGISQGIVFDTVFFALTSGLVIFGGSIGRRLVAISSVLAALLILFGILANPLIAAALVLSWNGPKPLLVLVIFFAEFVFFVYSGISLSGLSRAAIERSGNYFNRTNLVKLILALPLFCVVFCYFFSSGWLPALIVFPIMGRLLFQPIGFREGVAMAGFVVMAITLPIYRAIELTQSANQLAGYAQNYYSQHGHYPDTVPIPLIWNTGEMSAISYSAGDQEASVDESLFFFTRHDILLDHGKVSISDLD